MDYRLLQVVNQFARATGWLHPIVYGYATYGVAVFAALLVTGWWIARRAADAARMATALCAGAGTLLAVAINQPIVAAVARPRPYTVHPDLFVLAHRTSDFSFPSDHATMAGAAAAGLLLVSRRLGAVTVAAAVAIAGARVYIAAHYPTDVIAGLLLGATVSVVLYVLARGALTKLVTALGRSRLRPLIAAPSQAPPPGVP